MWTRTYRHAYQLLLVFHDRDSRTEFVGADNWLVKVVKPSVIMAEYQREKQRKHMVNIKGLTVAFSWDSNIPQHHFKQ